MLTAAAFIKVKRENALNVQQQENGPTVRSADEAQQTEHMHLPPFLSQAPLQQQTIFSVLKSTRTKNARRANSNTILEAGMQIREW